MKRNLSIGLALLCFLNLNAQKEVGGFVQLSIGNFIAGGDLARQDREPQSGFVKQGIHLSALFGHKIVGNFGGYASLGFSLFPVDDRAIARVYTDSADLYAWKVDAGIGTHTILGIGFQYNLNFTKTALNFRLGANSMSVIHPRLEMTRESKTGGENLLLIRQKASGSGYGWGAGMSFRYEFRWCWAAIANIEYAGATVRMDKVESTTRSLTSGQETRTVISYNQRNELLQFGLGLAYVF